MVKEDIWDSILVYIRNQLVSWSNSKELSSGEKLIHCINQTKSPFNCKIKDVFIKFFNIGIF